MKSPNSAAVWGCPTFPFRKGDSPRSTSNASDGSIWSAARNGRELLIYLTRPVPDYDAKAPRRVLERCHYRHADPLPLSGGVHDGRIVLLTRFPEREATAAGIEQAVRFLAAIMDTVAGN